MSIDIDGHVGRTLLAIDIERVCSPAIQAILPAGANPDDAVREFNAAFAEFMDEHFLPGKWEWSLDDGRSRFVLNARSGVIKSKEDRIAEFDKLLSAIHETQEASPPKPPPTHEKDGTLGWWHVDGVRHSAIVKASSAAEAVKLAEDADAVHSWESPDADWIGEELPNVVRC